jgi:galactitol-specific phosphotransferase system IIB component
MIVVVMVGMTIVFAYVAIYAQNYQAGVGSSILESMTIEDVWITGPQTVQLSVYNTGTATNLGTNVDLTVIAIYVDGTALTTSPTSNNINFNVLIGAGDHVTLDGYLQPGGPLSTFASGNTYDFKVVTLRGSSFQAQYTDP